MSRKKNEVLTKEEKGVIIYLGSDGIVTKVEEGIDFTLNKEDTYAIVAEVKDEGTCLKLYDSKTHFDVKEAYVEAFEYDCQREATCFLNEIDDLRKSIEYFSRTGLSREEKMELKKFIYCTYKSINRVCVN